MSKKKTPTSSKPSKKKITLSDGTVVHTDNNQKSAIRRGKITKHITPGKAAFSTETGKGFEDYKVTDDLDKLEYPPPSKNPVYRKAWANAIENISQRTNFDTSHLELLDTLCRLRVELKQLDDFIARHGHTFRVITALGDNRRTYPEVVERMKVLTQIATYSRLLDLLPKKDKSKGKTTKSDNEEWE